MNNLQLYQIEEEAINKHLHQKMADKKKNIGTKSKILAIQQQNPFKKMSLNNDTVLVAVVTKGTSIFYTYQAGTLQEFERITNTIPSDKVDKTPNKVQLHRLEHLHRHFKETAELIYKQIAHQNASHVVIIGHEEVTTKKFLDYLHPEVQNKLLITDNCSPEELADEFTIPSIVDTALIDYDNRQELNAAEELANGKGGKLVVGLEQVIHALNRGMVKSLYINGTYKHTGYICKKDHNLTMVERNCPVCNTKQQKVSNIIDEIIKVATNTVREVFIFKNHPEKMKEYNEVAAFVFGGI